MIEEMVQLFNESKLTEAIQIGNDAVAKNPRDLEVRIVLAQLVCFTGNWDRVEKITGQLLALDSERSHAALTNLISKLASGEVRRKAVWDEGVMPDFVQPPDEATKKTLWAMNCYRAGNASEFVESVDLALENAGEQRVTIDGASFDGFRDLDDTTCTVLEAHTLQGVYCWVPMAGIRSIDVAKPTRLVDHLWAAARIELEDNKKLSVYLPTTYYHSFDTDVSDSIRLGRETVWVDDDALGLSECKGRGRRIFVAGDDEFTVFDLVDAKLERVE